MADKTIVILISGRGSNMQALMQAALPARFAAVVSSEASAPGLEIARRHGVSTAIVDHRAYDDRTAFDTALAEEIDRHRPHLVLLAGFMRILTATFVRRYEGRIMNIHPSLLPAFPGLHTHREALRAGSRIHGCTVHFVTPVLDHGPIILQAAVAVLSDDTEETLAARVLKEEHRIYPQAVRWFCEDRLRLTAEGTVRIDGARWTAAALVSPPVEDR
jgi:phosphoribosylglycinamide formyltransferase-1